MADGSHQSALPPPSPGKAQPMSYGNGFPSHNLTENPVPSSGTYVIQIAKDQIYRYPPPENARRYQKRVHPKPRLSCCCRCLYWTLGLLGLIILLLAVAVLILYLVVRPKYPTYNIGEITIRDFNLTSRSSISPEFDVAIRAQNPSDKIGIYYGTGSSVIVYYSGVDLCNGGLLAFYQPPNNITILQTVLKGSKILLTSDIYSQLVNKQNQSKVPFSINVKAPVKIKVGALKTWTITITVKCDVLVDSLTTSSKIVSNNCKNSVKPW